MDAQRSAPRELRCPEKSIRREHVAELSPRPCDIVVLTGLYDLSSEPGSNTSPLIEVEPRKPRRWRARAQLDSQRVLVAVDWRRDNGVDTAVSYQLRRTI